METIAEDSTGILLESLLEGYAEFYSALKAEALRKGITNTEELPGVAYKEQEQLEVVED